MNLLLHMCCAPCAVYPVKTLREKNLKITGFFFNHNIHPFQEYGKRLDTVRQYAAQAGLDVVYRDDYDLEGFLGAVAATPSERCLYCYRSRLEATAATAVERNCDAFTTTLLYSRYQKHETIRKLGEEVAAKHGVAFLYEDFRPGWQEGIADSKSLGLYRQQYCGCIYSEKERYASPPKRSAK